MTVLAGYLFPHPPIIIHEIGRGRERESYSTVEASREAAKRIKNFEPDLIFVITSHGPLFSDGISVYNNETLEGDFKAFGEYSLEYEFENDHAFINEFTIKIAEHDNVITALIDDETAGQYNVSPRLDHGVLVPMHFISKEVKATRVVAMTYGMLGFDKLYAIGTAIRDTAISQRKKVVVVASGDLSHRLMDRGPYDYHPSGKVYDEMIVDKIRTGDIEGLVHMDTKLCREAGECGMRSIEVMLGALDESKLETEVLSYEGPFGVGYAVAELKVVGNREGLQDSIGKKMKERIKEIRASESKYVRLARKVVEDYVSGEGKLDFGASEFGMDQDLSKIQKGVFVSIKNPSGLRGCIGTFRPTKKNIGEEIVANAIQAATRDYRFSPIEPHELDDLIYSVDLLDTPESIVSLDDLDPEKYGVIVTKGYKRGLLLPNLDGIDSVEEQLRIAKNKAGIIDDEDVEIERFEVLRFY